MIALRYQNPAVPVPRYEDLLTSLYEVAIPQHMRNFWGMGLLDEEIPEPSTKNFSADELMNIFKGWAIDLGFVDKNHWGGIQLGFFTPESDDENAPWSLQLNMESFGETDGDGEAPILSVWILHAPEHWQGVDRVYRDDQEYMVQSLRCPEPWTSEPLPSDLADFDADLESLFGSPPQTGPETTDTTESLCPTDDSAPDLSPPLLKPPDPHQQQQPWHALRGDGTAPVLVPQSPRAVVAGQKRPMPPEVEDEGDQEEEDRPAKKRRR